ncbi:hypothetical protein ACFSW8_02800 [Rubritalea tangerina]|uniref:Glycoside hydrolase n=2 Tax=Rubritalea tangerina TaxID=430798 RepID=A0ABW4Z877_9BACT
MSQRPTCSVIGKAPLTNTFASFYQKVTFYHDLPIVSSAKVSSAAHAKAYEIVSHMLSDKPEVRAAIIRNKVVVAIMAPTELTTDIPEHSDLAPKEHWDQRARGLGATKSRPATSCGEENLLKLHDDRYKGENILIHEFAHTIHQMGINDVDPHFEQKLQALYHAAMEQKLWHGTYAATNHIEYWAEGVQCWYNANREASPPNGVHNHINTREELRAYDKALYDLIDQWFSPPPHTPKNQY